MENAYNLYNYRYKPVAYIIVNQKFVNKQRERLGANKDYEHMKEIFEQLGFELTTFWNKSADKIKNILETGLS